MRLRTAARLALILAVVNLAWSVFAFIHIRAEDDATIRADRAEVARLHQREVDTCREIKQAARRQGLLWVSEPADCEAAQ